MTRTLVGWLAGLVLLMGAPAAAQDAAAPMVPQGDRVALETDAGVIVIQTDPRAPITSANFLRYVDEGRLDGTSFYRSMVVVPGMGLIQGGTLGVASRTLPPIAHEPTSQTGLSHTDGMVSMARHAPGSAAGDFFIILGNLSSLDAGGPGGDADGFAAFGRVVEGMDVVRAIQAAPRSPTEGEGVMQGQMLAPRITIVRARRAPPSPPPASAPVETVPQAAMAVEPGAGAD